MIATLKTAAQIKRSICVGDVYDVTNHYITRKDHPSFGTTRRKVVRVNPSGITFDVGGHSYWPAASDISETDEGIEIGGHPAPGARFLTLKLVSRGDGAPCQSTPRPAPASNNYPPIESDDAHDIAARKSRYSHHGWVVWSTEDGRKIAARATAQNLDQVLTEIGDRKAVLYINGSGMIGKRGMIEVWRSNSTHSGGL